MAIIRPFKALRPQKGYEDKIAQLPYDVMNEAEAREMAKDNPNDFLYIDRAEINFEPGTDPHDAKVYKKAGEKLNELRENKALIQDENPCLYVYRLIREGRAQIGLAACVSVDEYNNNIIKKHELTREDKEQDRINHVIGCNAHTGPIFMTYKHKKAVDDIIGEIIKGEPVYDFTRADNVQHTVWVIAEDAQIAALQDAFADIENLYIADGHHRNAAAAKTAEIKKAQNPNHTGEEEYNYYLAVMFPENQLAIMDYNRLVKDLAGMTKDDFLEALQKDFTLEEAENLVAAKPDKPNTFAMYTDKKWYRLYAKEVNADDIIESLDVSILQEKVLKPILKIGDIRTDKRIDFVGGIRGLAELEKRVDGGEWAVAFALYPTLITQLIQVADEDKIMPPKSTWFEPKLLSGLLIHEI